jgi:hypothetical protein
MSGEPVMKKKRMAFWRATGGKASSLSMPASKQVLSRSEFRLSDMKEVVARKEKLVNCSQGHEMAVAMVVHNAGGNRVQGKHQTHAGHRTETSMRVLMGFYGGAHVTAAIPMIRELSRRGHDVVPLALTAAPAAMLREGLSHKTITDFVDPDNAEIAHHGLQLIGRHHTEGKGITKAQSIAYLGTSFADLAHDIGEAAAYQRYVEIGLNAFMPVRTARGIIENVAPDWVMATASPRMEAAMMRAGVELGVNTLCMVDLFAILELPWLRHPGHAHLLTVYGEKTAQRLISAGRRADAMTITGYPAFDALADPAVPEAARAWRAGNGLAPDEKAVLWADQPEPGNPEWPRAIRRRLQEVCARNGWKLVVRFHPASTDASKEELPEGAIVSPAEERLPVVAAAADVVCTCTSTVGMEALLSGKPVVIIRGSQYDHLVDYSEEDGALVVEGPGEIEPALRELLFGGAVAGRLAEQRHQLPAVGAAAARIADLMEANPDAARKFASFSSALQT